mmetsp:Transcript_66574/g.188154  ORF Transcript_66574/g.188154 Transcript_66574/m.188154 type:complete len:422 (-) Transcript_66574:1311-2576(-)
MRPIASKLPLVLDESVARCDPRSVVPFQSLSPQLTSRHFLAFRVAGSLALIFVSDPKILGGQEQTSLEVLILPAPSNLQVGVQLVHNVANACQPFVLLKSPREDFSYERVHFHQPLAEVRILELQVFVICQELGFCWRPTMRQSQQLILQLGHSVHLHVLPGFYRIDLLRKTARQLGIFWGLHLLLSLGRRSHQGVVDATLIAAPPVLLDEVTQVDGQICLAKHWKDIFTPVVLRLRCLPIRNASGVGADPRLVSIEVGAEGHVALGPSAFRGEHDAAAMVAQLRVVLRLHDPKLAQIPNLVQRALGDHSIFCFRWSERDVDGALWKDFVPIWDLHALPGLLQWNCAAQPLGLLVRLSFQEEPHVCIDGWVEACQQLVSEHPAIVRQAFVQQQGQVGTQGLLYRGLVEEVVQRIQMLVLTL